MSLDQCGSCKRNLTLDVTAETIPHMECQLCFAPATLDSEEQEFEERQPLKLCLACFCNPEKHSWTHPYIVARDLDTLPSPVGPRGWTQRQDFALLAGVDKLGYGNWDEICQVALKRAQTVEACKRRFEQLRMLIPGQVPLVEEDRSVEDARLRERADFARTAPGANLVGYLPLREEFDSVFANDAELLVADMVFSREDEDEQERGKDWYDLRMKVLRTYNAKLDVREQRRQFVLQRGLLDFQRIQDIRKKLSNPPSSSSSTPADVFIELESLSKYSSPQEQDQLEKGIVRERALREEIRKLQQYRAMGIRTFDEIESYNREAALRHQQSNNNVQVEPEPNKRVRVEEEDESKFAQSLNAAELKLCELAGLTPSRYLVAKECLMRESLKNGGCVSRPDATALLTIELSTLEAMLELFVKCEWIKREQPQQQALGMMITQQPAITTTIIPQDDAVRQQEQQQQQQ